MNINFKKIYENFGITLKKFRPLSLTGKPNIKPKPKPKPNPNPNPNPSNIKLKQQKVKELNKTKESDFIKSSDPPEVQQHKRSLLSQATDFITQNPGLALGAAGLAAYMFSSGKSLPDAIASLGESAGSAIGTAIGGVGSGIMNAVNSTISGITGIPKEYVKYIWWALLALFIFYLLLKIKRFFFGDYYTEDY